MNPPDSILGSPVSLTIWGSAPGAWPITFIEDELNEARTIDTETLLVSGSIDFSTPPQFAAEELEPFLTNGQHVFLAEYGHTQDFNNVRPEAAHNLLATFFDNGEADATGFTYLPMNYEVSIGFPTLMKIGLAVIVGLVISLILIVGWIVRKVKARRADDGL